MDSIVRVAFADLVARVAQDLIELAISKIGIPFRDAQPVLNDEVAQLATRWEGVPDLLLCELHQLRLHDWRVRVQLEDGSVDEAKNPERVA